MTTTHPEQQCADGRLLYTGTDQDDQILKYRYNSDGVTDPQYLVFGLDGDDRITGANNDDALLGGPGEDQITANGGNDSVWGHEDYDRLRMGGGDDYADGGSGNDFIRGDAGNDTLIGGLGSDRIYGDSGEDLFVVHYERGTGRHDNIYDMEAGEKLIIEGVQSVDYKLSYLGRDLVLLDEFGQEIATLHDLAAPQSTYSSRPERGSRVRIQGNLVEIVESIDRHGVFVETVEGAPSLPQYSRDEPVACTPTAAPADTTGDSETTESPESIDHQETENRENDPGNTDQQPTFNDPDSSTDPANPSSNDPVDPVKPETTQQTGSGTTESNTGLPTINIVINNDNSSNNSSNNSNNNSSSAVNDFSTEIVAINTISLDLDDMISSDRRRNEQIKGSSDDDLIGSGLGRNNLQGRKGADTFVFDEQDKFNKKSADVITDFSTRQGDQLVVSDGALPDLDDPSFAVATSKRELKALARDVVDLIYHENKGRLFYNQNGDDGGMGEGGLFAVLKNKPELTSENIAMLA